MPVDFAPQLADSPYLEKKGCKQLRSTTTYLHNCTKILSYDDNRYLPGAIIISCFVVLILRNFKWFWGSRSRTVILALAVSWWTSPAYWTVVALSIVVRIGIPVRKKAIFLAQPRIYTHRSVVLSRLLDSRRSGQSHPCETECALAFLRLQTWQRIWCRRG